MALQRLHLDEDRHEAAEAAARLERVHHERDMRHVLPAAGPAVSSTHAVTGAPRVCCACVARSHAASPATSLTPPSGDPRRSARAEVIGTHWPRR